MSSLVLVREGRVLVVGAAAAAVAVVVVEDALVLGSLSFALESNASEEMVEEEDAMSE